MAVLKKGKTEVDDPNLSIINRFNNKMHKTQDVASLQANNRSLMQELEAMTIRHKAALQHNQQLASQNQYLFDSLKNHLEDDWEQHKKDSDHMNFNGEHFSTLERVKEQLTESLNALTRPPPSVFQTLKQYDSQQSITARDQTLLDDDFDSITALSKQLEAGSPSIVKQFKQKLQQYHNKAIVLMQQLKHERSKMQRFDKRRISLEDSLNEAKQANKNIYNQLLEVTLQLQSAERSRSQLNTTEDEREKLKQMLSNYEKQNKMLKEHLQTAPQQRQSSDTQDYEELIECYQQIATLKQKINETNQSTKGNQVFFQSDKAELQLAHLLTKKKLQQNENYLKQLRKHIEESESNNAESQSREKEIEEYKEQIYLLKIKVFALQSLEIGNKYKVSRDLYFQDFFQKIKPYIENIDDWKLQALQLMAQNHSIIKNLQKKLEEEESEAEKNRKKYRSYKEKYQNLAKSRLASEAEMMEGYKVKSKEYTNLIEKMQTQMEKTLGNQNQVKEMAKILAAPLQQQLELATKQNAFMQNELIIKDQMMADQTLKFESEANKLLEEIDKIKQDNISLQRANRQSQSMLLEHNLNLAVSRIKGSSNKNQAKKSSIQSEQKSLIQTLEQEITLLRSRLQQQSDLLSKQTVKNQKLTSLTNNQARQLEEYKTEIRQAKNKQKESMMSNQSPLIFSQTQVPRLNSMKEEQKGQEEQIKTLQAKIAELKKELSKQRKFASELTERAQNSIQDASAYKKRIEELQRTLHAENKEKQRIIQQRNMVLRQNQQYEQQLQMIKGNPSSLKNIEWLQQNKDLQTQIQILKNSLEKKTQQLQIALRKLQSQNKQNDIFCEEIVKLQNIIKDYNIHVNHDEQAVNTQKYTEEMNHRVEQLYKQIKNLKEDKEVLSNLIEELRNKSMSAHSINSLQGNSQSLDAAYLKSSLLKAQKELKSYKKELELLEEEKQKEKEKMKTELQAISRQLEFYKKGGIKPFVGKGSISSRGFSERENSEQDDDFYHNGAIVKSEVIDPMKEIELKNIIIRQLKDELQEFKQERYNQDPQIYIKPSSGYQTHLEPTYGQTHSFKSFELFKVPQTVSKKVETKSVAVGPDEEQEDRSDVYLRQLFELREENQKMRQSKLQNDSKIRTLEEQNSTLRFKLLSGINNKYSHSSEYRNISTGPEVKHILPPPKPLEPYSLHSSNYSNPDSSLGYEDKISVQQGLSGKISMPEQYRSKSSIQPHQKSKFSLPEDRVIEYEIGNPSSFKMDIKSREKQEMQILAPLVQSIEGFRQY